MSSTRLPAVAGHFYPDEGRELKFQVRAFLQEIRAVDGFSPKALIVPHAGYRYSGVIAASAYARVAKGRHTLRRVLLVGPGHRFAFHGLALSSADQFITPLGAVPLDHAQDEELLKLSGVRILDEAHEFEHSLEVQLPFLQEVLDDFKIVPIVVGDAPVVAVANVLERLWGGGETLIVISSDLSHYQNYERARAEDFTTSQAILQLYPEGIFPHAACGQLPLKALLLVAKKKGLNARSYDLRNSGDTVGERERVVGYGAYGFE